LTSCFGNAFVLLSFSDTVLPEDLTERVKVIRISSQGQPAQNTLVDERGQARARYGASDGSTYLVRPDGYLMGCWKTADAAAIANALKPFQQENTVA
jgi:3-(3-hydroxy-phenyl)propionate hydroxylase